MHNTEHKALLNQTNRRYITFGGIALIIIGATILLDRWLQTGWLALAILPLMGFLLLFGGIRTHQLRLILSGGILSGLGLAMLIFLGLVIETNLEYRVGLSLVVFGLGWWLVTLLTSQFASRTAWWAMVPGGMITALGAFFIYSPMGLADLALYSLTSLGFVLILWGFIRHLFGLIIPGALLVSIGPAIYLSWGINTEINLLTRTGILLVVFALGWFLITILSRAMTARFVWWPLIPGGVLAMVGWGLYIGGNPEGAAVFISNTGSIGLILFGIYLLLIRKGIQG